MINLLQLRSVFSPFSTQMRSSMDMSKRQNGMLREMEETLTDLMSGHLPGIMEEVVHRNTKTVISSVDQTSKKSVEDLQEKIKRQVVQEMFSLLEVATDDVVERVGAMLQVQQPV